MIKSVSISCWYPAWRACCCSVCRNGCQPGKAHKMPREETTYAADTRTEKTSEDTRSSAASQCTHLLAGAQPVVQSVQAPQVRGVAVLCQGGGNAGTQRRITELVSALTGVGASHITVNKMQS